MWGLLLPRHQVSRGGCLLGASHLFVPSLLTAGLCPSLAWLPGITCLLVYGLFSVEQSSTSASRFQSKHGYDYPSSWNLQWLPSAHKIKKPRASDNTLGLSLSDTLLSPRSRDHVLPTQPQGCFSHMPTGPHAHSYNSGPNLPNTGYFQSLSSDT